MVKLSFILPCLKSVGELKGTPISQDQPKTQQRTGLYTLVDFVFPGCITVSSGQH